jgi:aldehyde:ferredoxin oxidoreductase
MSIEKVLKTLDGMYVVLDKTCFYPEGGGQPADIGYLKKVGERIVNLERAFNVREGFGRQNDKLPPRMLNEPLHTYGAPGEGEVVRETEQFLDRYYELRGWTEDGIPTTKKLGELGLSKMAKDMSQKRRKNV